jgi:prepilin-type N-terminal cleavage/methylation domain-containing protein
MRKSKRHGFTLIELLVVIAIIAVLVSIAFPVFNTVQERARAAQDMSNLRQIGLATQMYMNDNDGVIFSSNAGTWMSQLEPKYIPAWKIFESPFDKRTPSEIGDATTPVSYGLNGNKVAGTLSDKIQNPSGMILFAPTPTSQTSLQFAGTAVSTGTGVTVKNNFSSPGGFLPAGTAHGTYSSRTRINAVFADTHTETLPWTTFTSDAADQGSTCSGGGTPSVSQRWHPDPCNP